MRLLHLSDLHLGRRLFDVSLLEDQQYILGQILHLLDQNTADAVILAGDIYDKPVPSAEAVCLLDWFLKELSDRGLPVLMVSGNHDSAERLGFASGLLGRNGVHVSPMFRGAAEPVVLQDEYGPVNCYLLPFIKPIHAKRVWPDAGIETYTDAVAETVRQCSVRTEERNLLVAHQLVTGAVRSESESLSIGGLDDVSAEVFAPFDYVALGHIHSAQSAGSPHIRYCGTPLAYSFSEADREKTVTWVELGPKGSVTVTEQALKPLRPMRKLRGEFCEIMALPGTDDYLHVTLTDEEDVPYGLSRLRDKFTNLLTMEYDNLRTRMQAQTVEGWEDDLSPMELLERFYEQRNGQPMSYEQRQLSQMLMEEIWEELL